MEKIKNTLFSLKYQFYVIFHPFNGFYDLKYEKKGNLTSAIVFLTIYFFSVVLKDSLVGYLFQSDTNSDFSLFICILSSIAPIGLFTVSNWCLTLLLNGEGKMEQIFISLSYALFPLSVYNFIFTLLSNFFTIDESLYLTLMFSISVLWTAFLVIVAVMQTNQYGFIKSIFACILSIVGIAVLLLIILLCGDVIGQVFGFVTSIVKELSYR